MVPLSGVALPSEAVVPLSEEPGAPASLQGDPGGGTGEQEYPSHV
jgi:hypothetical protein